MEGMRREPEEEEEDVCDLLLPVPVPVWLPGCSSTSPSLQFTKATHPPVFYHYNDDGLISPSGNDFLMPTFLWSYINGGWDSQ